MYGYWGRKCGAKRTNKKQKDYTLNWRKPNWSDQYRRGSRLHGVDLKQTTPTITPILTHPVLTDPIPGPIIVDENRAEKPSTSMWPSTPLQRNPASLDGVGQVEVITPADERANITSGHHRLKTEEHEGTHQSTAIFTLFVQCDHHSANLHSLLREFQQCHKTTGHTRIHILSHITTPNTNHTVKLEKSVPYIFVLCVITSKVSIELFEVIVSFFW